MRPNHFAMPTREFTVNRQSKNLWQSEGGPDMKTRAAHRQVVDALLDPPDVTAVGGACIGGLSGDRIGVFASRTARHQKHSQDEGKSRGVPRRRQVSDCMPSSNEGGITPG